MASGNRIKNVAIVGAGGNSGRYMTDALIRGGTHTLTAITRTDSTSQLPSGILSKQVDYDNPETIVQALKGQDALVITLSGAVPRDTEEKLVRAAAEAGVPWILPNEWSPDTANEALVKDVFVFQTKPAIRELIAELGKSSFIGISTGFWYEWSLSLGAGFGIDFTKKHVTFYDDGETKISTSTWPQIGRAVTALLSLPVQPEGSDQGACLEHYKNSMVYIKSFTVSQKEMFQSALRVTGTKEAEWTIAYEPAEERYQQGIEQIQKGERMGYAKMMYTRLFFKDGVGNTEKSRGVANGVLELPQEDLDEATERAELRSRSQQWTG